MRAAAFFGSIVATCAASALSTPAANSQTASLSCESIQDKQSQAACFNQADLIVIDCARPRDANEGAFCRETLGNNKVIRGPPPGKALPHRMNDGNMNNGMTDKKMMSHKRVTKHHRMMKHPRARPQPLVRATKHSRGR